MMPSTIAEHSPEATPSMASSRQASPSSVWPAASRNRPCWWRTSAAYSSDPWRRAARTHSSAMRAARSRSPLPAASKALDDLEEGRRPRVGAVLRDDPRGPGDPPATLGDVSLDDLLGAEPERRLGRRERRRRARAGSCRRAPGSRSSPASAPAGARSRRTGRSPRRRAGPRSRLRRTRRRRAARRARRTPSGPPELHGTSIVPGRSARRQRDSSTGPRGASLL